MGTIGKVVGQIEGAASAEENGMEHMRQVQVYRELLGELLSSHQG